MTSIAHLAPPRIQFCERLGRLLPVPVPLRRVLGDDCRVPSGSDGCYTSPSRVTGCDLIASHSDRIENLMLERLHNSLDKRLQIGRLVRGSFNPRPHGREHGIEGIDVLRIVVTL